MSDTTHDLAALADHVRRVDAYFAARALAEQDIRRKSQRERDAAEAEEGKAETLEGKEPHAEAILKMDAAADAELAAWDRANRPDLDPMDTPGRLGEEAGNVVSSARLREMMGIAGYSPHPDDDGRERDRLKGEYEHHRDRALAFVVMVPDIAERLPWLDDYERGIKAVTEWGRGTAARLADVGQPRAGDAGIGAFLKPADAYKLAGIEHLAGSARSKAYGKLHALLDDDDKTGGGNGTNVGADKWAALCGAIRAATPGGDDWRDPSPQTIEEAKLAIRRKRGN